MSCSHGWRGTPAGKITTPCPACGAQSLFIGDGGHLTCSVVGSDHGAYRGCPEPGVESEINNLKAALEDALTTLVAIAAQPATAGRLWADNPTLGATLVRVRKALRQADPPDPISPKRFQA